MTSQEMLAVEQKDSRGFVCIVTDHLGSLKLEANIIMVEMPRWPMGPECMAFLFRWHVPSSLKVGQ